MITRLVIALLLSLPINLVFAEQALEGNYLYKVSTIRAATGKFSNLLDWIEAVKDSGYHEQAGLSFPLVMRHSQGDQWDLMMIEPINSWIWYYSELNSERRDKAAVPIVKLMEWGDTLIAFEEDHFAYGPPFDVLKKAYTKNGFYHIEMFDAAPGKAGDLFEQRRMENAYLKATNQTTNMIFRRAAGSNVDVFTIGFHQNLEAFAAPSAISDEDKEVAAKAAGFKDRADLSFYLRSLISAHHDTLAVKVD